MTYPELYGFAQLAWSTALKPWGLTVSLWYRPSDGACAYLYKHSSGHWIAKTYEEQITVHRRFGIPVVGPGEEFEAHRVSVQPRPWEVAHS